MRELVRLVEEPRACSYLPAELAALEYRIVQDLESGEYEELLARGYRRFGRQLFRPQCPSCVQCVSVRVRADLFGLSANQRRVWRRNAHIRAVRERVFVTDEHVALYNRYHRFMAAHRGWRHERISRTEYFESFVAGGRDFAWQWLYYDAERLVGVALMDETLNAISLVYHFHDPCWRSASPGTFSILTQLEWARESGKTYAYPGYWIAADTSMAYKSRFRPFERLLRHPPDQEPPHWLLADDPSFEPAKPLINVCA